VIVDASVAVKWLVFDEGSERALDLLKGELAAPSIWLAEPANALRAKCARGEISEQEACDFALDLLDAPVAPIDLRELPSVAMRMALDLNHPIYDCLYLAAALFRNTTLTTADRRLVAKAAHIPTLRAEPSCWASDRRAPRRSAAIVLAQDACRGHAGIGRQGQRALSCSTAIVYFASIDLDSPCGHAEFRRRAAGSGASER
jgi:predicted nucleic acid-binding protein